MKKLTDLLGVPCPISYGLYDYFVEQNGKIKCFFCKQKLNMKNGCAEDCTCVNFAQAKKYNLETLDKQKQRFAKKGE